MIKAVRNKQAKAVFKCIYGRYQRGEQTLKKEMIKHGRIKVVTLGTFLQPIQDYLNLCFQQHGELYV